MIDVGGEERGSCLQLWKQRIMNGHVNHEAYHPSLPLLCLWTDPSLPWPSWCNPTLQQVVRLVVTHQH